MSLLIIYSKICNIIQSISLELDVIIPFSTDDD